MLSLTGLPLCPTCGRLESQHTNPVAHAFGKPWIVAPWRRRPLRSRSGARRTDFGARIDLERAALAARIRPRGKSMLPGFAG